VDRARDGVSPLSALDDESEITVDLHTHSTASDGEHPPEEVVARAAGAGLAAIALTDHDTLDGLPAAIAAGERLGVRVVSGCEFSVSAPWGEMHLLGYYLPPAHPPVESFLVRCRADRLRRVREMVDRLQAIGVRVTVEDVLREADGGSLGRPHVARALVGRGAAMEMNEAFHRFIGRGKVAFVEKALPAFREVAELVHSVGGVVSAAHLKDRATRPVLRRLMDQGLDAVETRHPSHDPETRARITEHALALGLLRTGGSDWHGDGSGEDEHAPLGSQRVPLEWLERLDARRAAGVAP
jgi:predicted metal-dependent phosphoesterase TrpH